MMKTLFAALLLSFAWITGLQAQSPAASKPVDLITILHVKGQVFRAGEKQSLRPGETIRKSASITFADRKSRIVAFDSLKGVIGVESHLAAGGKFPALDGPLASFIVPIKTSDKPARADHFGSVKALKPIFEAREYLVLGSTYLLADKNYHLDGDTVFLVKYQDPVARYNGGHKLESAGDTLWITQTSILDRNGVQADPETITDYRIWWFCSPDRSYQEITYCNFVFADENQLMDEINMLLKKMPKSKAVEQQQAIQQLIEFGYGEADAHNYRSWMLTHFPVVFKPASK